MRETLWGDDWPTVKAELGRLEAARTSATLPSIEKWGSFFRPEAVKNPEVCPSPITQNLVQRHNEREGESTHVPKNDRWP
jgi:hypothetical protein